MTIRLETSCGCFRYVDTGGVSPPHCWRVPLLPDPVPLSEWLAADSIDELPKLTRQTRDFEFVGRRDSVPVYREVLK